MPDEGTRDPTLTSPVDAETQPGVPLGRETSLAAGGTGRRYHLGELIGKGGMGDVIAAEDQQIGRGVAVKRMKAAHPSEHAMARFFREACTQGRLDHPAIVPVHELGVDDAGRPFFTMKRLTGTTLHDHIARRTPRARLLRAFADVCLAVEFAHSRDVIHRDLKPHNIVLGEYGDVYVLDWGVAKLLGESHDPTPDIASDDPAAPLTVDGAVVGTPGYMAPEQARSPSDVDARADVYSLGCILYEILSCERLNPGGGEGLRRAIAGEDGRGRTQPARFVPELDAAWLAATAPDRDGRLATARELGEQVHRFLDGDRDLATRRELARTHLDAALAAFADPGSETSRSVAMREAGKALALDPALTGAAELVGRLMLEPPLETPAEVERSMLDEDIEMQFHRGRAAIWGHVGYLPMLAVVIAVGAGWYALGVAAAILLNVGLIARDLRRRRITNPLGAMLVSAASVLIAIGCLFSPFLVAPAIAAVVGMAAALGAFLDTRGSTALTITALIAAVLVPAVGEQVGLLPRTLFVESGTLVFHPPGLAGSPTFIWVALVIYVLSLIPTAIGMGRMMRVGDRGARRQLHLQAWQLRQLVADPGGAARAAS